MPSFKRYALGLCGALLAVSVSGQQPAPANPSETVVLRPARVFDGERLQDGWAVRIRGRQIEAAGPAGSIDAAGVPVVDLPGLTLLPGLIEGHSHVLLHAYDETPWTDQVLKEPLGLRTARAVNHLRQTLDAGFTTIRDLGTEGAAYADAELKQAVEQGIVPGPRMLVTTRAIVATGSYAPKGFAPQWDVPQGAEEADGDALVRVVRSQIGRGADWIKVYADYRWGARGEAAPTFSLAELTTIVETARSSGRPVVAHASTAEGMRRAALAGVETIDHGDGGTPEVFALMAERGVALCPTLSAGDATAQYAGWKKGEAAAPASITREAGELRRGARRGRDDPQRQRRRRVSARRQRARAGADGRLRHVSRLRRCAARPPRRRACCISRTASDASRRVCSRTSSRSRAIRSRTSRRCGASAS